MSKNKAKVKSQKKKLKRFVVCGRRNDRLTEIARFATSEEALRFAGSHQNLPFSPEVEVFEVLDEAKFASFFAQQEIIDEAIRQKIANFFEPKTTEPKGKQT